MKKGLYNFFIGGRSFEKEFKRQIRFFVIITLGFTIAFTWRQTVFDVSQTFVQFITHIKDSALSSILTSTFITLLSILIIFFTAHFLREKPHH